MVSGHLGNVTKYDHQHIVWQSGACKTDMAGREPEFETIALHGAQEPDPINGSRALPLYQTCAYNFTDAADGASKFACTCRTLNLSCFVERQKH